MSTEFPFVESVDQLRENLQRLPTLIEEDHRTWRKMFRHARQKYWVFDEQSEVFAPNKWAAFYGLGTKIEHVGTNYNGTTCKVAIEQACKPLKYKAVAGLDARLRQWAARLIPPNGLDGIDSSGWQFIVLPVQPQEIALPTWLPVHTAQSRVTRTVRDTALSKRVKLDYDFTCLMCGVRIGTPGGGGYAEAAHIRPLGHPHRGPDELGNLIVVCPNHHVQFDAGLLSIDPDTLAIRFVEGAQPQVTGRLRLRDGHLLRREHVEYHLSRIFRH